MLDRELDRRHPVVVAADVPDAVQSGRLVQTAQPEDLLHPAHVDVEEVDDRRPGPGQLGPDHVVGRGGEHQRCRRAVHRFVEDRDDPAGLLDRGDEREQASLEPGVRELDQQRVPHGLGADAGAVGEEEDRYHVPLAGLIGHGASSPTGCRWSLLGF